ncbi:MAG: hypothetical protein HY647_13875 [Acidobacteria bacterium]|nr:hypothetical protein [Acidobacteriota bacterium]
MGKRHKNGLKKAPIKKSSTSTSARPLLSAQYSNPGVQGVQTKDIALWCWAAVMAIALYLAPEKTPLWVVSGLIIAMAVLAAHPVLHIPWVLRATTARSRIFRSGMVMLGMIVIIGLYGWFVWPHSRRHMLTERERYNFEKPLTEQKEAREEVQLACPQADENTCIYAAQFINFFREAGWKVQGNVVERGMLGSPLPGVILVKRGTGQLDPNNWRSGLWMRFSPSLESVRQAFVNIGVEPDSIVDANLSENVIRVYIGSEKGNAAERTSLTDAMERIEQERRKGIIPKRQ